MKIVIIDDDKLVCLSLKTIIESDGDIQVVSVGFNGNDALELYNKYKPDVMLMDIRMPKLSGLEAGEIILKKDKDAKILFLTTFLDDEYIIKALRMGAKGYIIKENFESISPSLRAVYTGQSVFGERIVTKIPSFLDKTDTYDLTQFNLTKRESEIIFHVAQGLSNKEIAAQLYLSEGTIRNSISAILAKLMLRDRTQLAIFYYTNIG